MMHWTIECMASFVHVPSTGRTVCKRGLLDVVDRQRLPQPRHGRHGKSSPHSGHKRQIRNPSQDKPRMTTHRTQMTYFQMRSMLQLERGRCPAPRCAVHPLQRVYIKRPLRGDLPK